MLRNGASPVPVASSQSVLPGSRLRRTSVPVGLPPTSIDADQGARSTSRYLSSMTYATPHPPGPDADLCNGEELCQTGACTPSAPLVCDDGDTCTTDVCDATRGCQFPEIESFDGIACLCSVGLASPGCATPGAVVGQFSKGCALAARATDAKVRKQRRLLDAAVKKFNKAGGKTRRFVSKNKLSPECGDAINTTLADMIGRTLNLRGRI